MDNLITIAKGSTSVTMPRTRDISYGGAVEEKKTQMASGKIVTDIIGFRGTVKAVWDWVPAETIRALNALLRQGGFFDVTHPTPDGEVTEKMTVSFPTMEVFTFRRGMPVWHSVTLDMSTQKVTRYESG